MLAIVIMKLSKSDHYFQKSFAIGTFIDYLHFFELFDCTSRLHSLHSLTTLTSDNYLRDIFVFADGTVQLQFDPCSNANPMKDVFAVETTVKVIV